MLADILAETERLAERSRLIEWNLLPDWLRLLLCDIEATMDRMEMLRLLDLLSEAAMEPESDCDLLCDPDLNRLLLKDLDNEADFQSEVECNTDRLILRECERLIDGYLLPEILLDILLQIERETDRL